MHEQIQRITFFFLFTLWLENPLCALAIRLTSGIHLNRSSQLGFLNCRIAVVCQKNPVNASLQLRSLAERLLQALLDLSPPDAFPHASYIQTPSCIEKYIYRVVPCSDGQVVFFIKGSEICKHNHCSFVWAFL